MDEAELIFNFFFILLCICIVYPPTEFVSLGLTLPQLFSGILGSEDVDFVRYHQKRTSLTLFVQGTLPALYFIIYYLQFPSQYAEHKSYQAVTWNVAQRLSILAALFIPAVICYWAQQDWKQHPISKLLNKFANTPSGYAALAADISNECRRQDVLRMEINTITSLTATENWIIKTTPYFVYFSHQSDTTLCVNKVRSVGPGPSVCFINSILCVPCGLCLQTKGKTETFIIAQDTTDTIQIINIVVTPSRPGVPEFQIRINALDFKTLQDRLNRPITIPSNIQFHRSLIERFIEAFKEQVTLNPSFQTNQVIESCFACMLAEPNIKLQKHCLDVDENGQPLPDDSRCGNCYCRPMWCVECLARWFAARQSEFEREIWLQKKCSCPMCRAPFCILDVCYVEKTES